MFKTDLDRSATNRLLRKFRIGNDIMRLSDLQDIASEHGKMAISAEINRYTKVINIIREGEHLFLKSRI